MITRTIRPTGAVSVSDSGGVPGVSVPPFVVGDPPQWNDNSEASYADLETFEHPDVSYADAGIAALPIAPTIHENPVGLTVTARVRYQSMSPSMGPPRVHVVWNGTSPDKRVLYWSFPNAADPSHSGSPDPTWVDLPLSAVHAESATMFVDRARNFGDLQLVVFAPYLRTIPHRLSRTRIYEARLIVTTAGGNTPPRRLWPREDENGIGGNQIWPPPATRQASNRIDAEI